MYNGSRHSGVLLAAGSGTRLYPLTDIANKHLLPVFNKPMIYYPLTTLILLGVTHFVFVLNERDTSYYGPILRLVKSLGFTAELALQPDTERGIPSALNAAQNFTKSENMIVILGDNILYGNTLTQQLKKCLLGNYEKSVCFTKKVDNPENFGVAVRDNTGTVTSLMEKPSDWVSNEAIIGLYKFTADVFENIATLSRSKRDETEVIDLLEILRKKDRLVFEPLTRGAVWLDAGTFSSLAGSSEYVRIIESRQADWVGSPEEAAYRVGALSKRELGRLIGHYPDSPYKSYLAEIDDT